VLAAVRWRERAAARPGRLAATAAAGARDQARAKGGLWPFMHVSRVVGLP
jgi:hypothetical protein